MRKHLLYTNDDETIRIIMHRSHGSNDGTYFLQRKRNEWFGEDKVNSWNEMALEKVETWANENKLNGSIVTTRDNLI